MKYLIKIKNVFCLSFVLLLAGISCSNTPPNVIEDRWLLVEMADAGGKKDHEELILFLHVEDEGGQDDIKELEMTLEDTGYTWRINQNDSFMISSNHTYWYGSNRFVMPGGSDFPEGAFHVTMRDRSGVTGEYRWFLSRKKEKNFENPPAVQYRSGKLMIKDRSGRDWMLLFYQDGSYISRQYMKSDVNWDLPERLQDESIECYLLYVDHSDLRGWMVGPYSLD